MPKDALSALLDRYPPDVQSLALDTRKFILEVLPNAQETVDDKAGVAGYGYETGYSDIVCTVIVSKSGVKLGLAKGASLPDPDGLLEGKGRVHRYVQLHKASDLSRGGVRKLVLAARAAWQQRNEAKRPH